MIQQSSDTHTNIHKSDRLGPPYFLKNLKLFLRDGPFMKYVSLINIHKKVLLRISYYIYIHIYMYNTHMYLLVYH